MSFVFVIYKYLWFMLLFLMGVGIGEATGSARSGY